MSRISSLKRGLISICANRAVTRDPLGWNALNGKDLSGLLAQEKSRPQLGGRSYIAVTYCVFLPYRRDCSLAMR